MMTSRGFSILAEALRRAKPHEDDDEIAHRQWAQDIRAVMDALAVDNPRFARDLFIVACDAQDHPRFLRDLF